MLRRNREKSLDMYRFFLPSIFGFFEFFPEEGGKPRD
jgi:hypothetical protein